MSTELRGHLSSQAGIASSFPCSLFPGNGDLCPIPAFTFPGQWQSVTHSRVHFSQIMGIVVIPTLPFPG